MILLALLGVLLWSPLDSIAAVAFVKTSTQGSCASAASCTTSFASLPAAGAPIIVAISCYTASADCAVSSVTDNQGNSYTQATCFTNDTGVGNNQACLYYDESTTSPSGTFTVTANAASGSSFELIAIEYSGILTPTPVDVTKTAKNTTGTADTGASGSTTQADEVSICVASVAANNTNIAITTPTGYTRRGVAQNAQATIGLEFSDKILSSTGAQQCAWSHSTTSMDGWAAVLATFKASAGGAAPTFGVLRRRSS